MQWPYRALSKALEVIPRTLVENCGGSTIRLLTELRAKHAQHVGDTMCTIGIDGNQGELADMNDLKVLFYPFLFFSCSLALLPIHLFALHEFCLDRQTRLIT
jgi:hypothetical protein